MIFLYSALIWHYIVKAIITYNHESFGPLSLTLEKNHGQRLNNI